MDSSDRPTAPQEPSILEQAQALVYGDRNAAYGHPKDNFQNIAALWTEYLGIKQRHQKHTTIILSPIDIAALNILQKLARVATNPGHMDSWTDIAGYAGTAERIVRNV